ncbi:B2 protein-like [Canna indica]|uniref:B2 protein-like n=1 Tax=Canna indica TaxID=4628 RepID=A0AAQ3QB54_9LILI|nr:B2 protein-like [Canna indica]
METQSSFGNYRDQASFWQFSDQLRLQASALSNLSIGDSIWSDSYAKQNLPSSNSSPSEINGGTAAGWKSAFGGSQKLAFGTSNYGLNRYNNADSSRKNGDVARGVKSSNYFGDNYNDYFNAINKAVGKQVGGNGKKGSSNNNDGGSGKKKKNANNNNNSGNNNSSNGNNKETAVDKRFKTLPPSESLPRNEAIGGYIFVCNNDTMEENLRRQLFGLPSRYRDSVRAITPGLPLFLYNYSTHQLHGIFESASFGGSNIDPTAWEDKKCPGESRFPAQVCVDYQSWFVYPIMFNFWHEIAIRLCMRILCYEFGFLELSILNDLQHRFLGMDIYKVLLMESTVKYEMN